MNKLTLYFIAPREIAIKEDEIPTPGPEEVLVKTILSSISPGTEMLVYRNQLPRDIVVDESIPSLRKDFNYPLRYGYSNVGKIIDCGEKANPELKNSIVFAFHPHESHFVASPNDLLYVPNEISPEEASFLANVETAVNLLMDGHPMIGENIAIFGQGIVGLLTASIIAKMPISNLLTVDKFPLRRQKSLEVGADQSLDLSDSESDKFKGLGIEDKKYDLTYELTGNPDVLDKAIGITVYSGRVVIGSWYGKKTAELFLGGKFHRDRINIISSQVTTIDPKWTGRWNKKRRLEVAWEIISLIKPSHFITHKIPIANANEAYSLIDKDPSKTIQVLLTYPE
jgi:2-desacetyl-2-hydroxyethyl bacteriochlorophyllide A dehydrogenase